MGDGVYPREENNGPGDELMESDVLVELYYAIQRRLSCQRDQGPADGEDDQSNVEMEHQRSGPGDGVPKPERRPCVGEIILQMVVEESKGKDHGVGRGKDQDKESP